MKRYSVSGKTRREVQEKIAQILVQQQQGLLASNTDFTVEEWMTVWLNQYMKHRLRPTTWDSYERLTRCHILPHLGRIRPRDLRVEHLQSFYEHMLKDGRVDKKGSLSTRTVRYIHAILHHALKQALRNGLLIRNVCEAAVLPREERREMRPLSLEEAQKIFQIARDHRLYAAFAVSFGTRLRRGELLGLKWDDVDLDARLLTVRRTLIRTRAEGGGSRRTRLLLQEPKTERSKRTIPLPESLVAILREHQARQNSEKSFFGETYQDHGLIFCTEQGDPIDPRNFTRLWDHLLKQAGVPHARFHDVRHTWATMMLEAGEDLKVVSELGGHSQIRTTADTYSHVTVGLKRRAEEKMGSIVEQVTAKRDPGDGRRER